MNNVILLTVAGLLLVLPFVGWLNERRLRLAAEERLKIARAVTEFEKLLLKGEIKGGQVCHDIVFPSMYRAQFCSNYPIPFPVRTPEARLFSARLREELDDGKSPAAKPITAFRNAYFGALIYTHPIKISILIVCLVAVFIVRTIVNGQMNAALSFVSLCDRLRSRLAAESAARLTVNGSHCQCSFEDRHLVAA